MLDSRRVLAPASKVLGSDTKTHLESRCCLQGILVHTIFCSTGQKIFWLSVALGRKGYWANIFNTIQKIGRTTQVKTCATDPIFWLSVALGHGVRGTASLATTEEHARQTVGGTPRHAGKQGQVAVRCACMCVRACVRACIAFAQHDYCQHPSERASIGSHRAVLLNGGKRVRCTLLIAQSSSGFQRCTVGLGMAIFFLV